MGERGSIARHDYAELGDGNSGNGRRNGGSGGGGKQEFVLLATVEAMMERGTGEKRWVGDFGGDARGETQAFQVQGDTVAQVHAGAGFQRFPEVAAHFETGFRMRVSPPGSAFSCFKAEC